MTGPVRALLVGERTALNCLARSSGIASHARELNKIAKDTTVSGQEVLLEQERQHQDSKVCIASGWHSNTPLQFVIDDNVKGCVVCG